MYVFSKRYPAQSGTFYEDVSSTGQTTGSRFCAYDFPVLSEYVYSFRTGRGALLDSHPGAGTSDGFGVRRPSTSGGLAAQLAERKRYTEELLATAIPAQTNTGTPDSRRLSASDTGNLFATVKHHFVPAVFTRYVNLTFDNGKSRVVGTVDCGTYSSKWRAVNSTPYTWDDTLYPPPAGAGTSQAFKQGIANRVFEQTAPFRSEAQLGVTLVELLRGDIPGILRNWRKLGDEILNPRQWLGSEYLNVVFGWRPLMVEAANILKVGLSLHKAAFYDSYKRSRRWDGPSGRSLGDTWFYPDGPGAVSGPGFHRYYSYSGGALPSFGGQRVDGQERLVWSEDYSFSSRYTGLSRPSAAVNGFEDRAREILKRIGLVDDPRLIWDLMPYSWLVDWFTTVGASVSNASVYAPQKGRYAVDYAYFTTKYTQTRTWETKFSLDVPKRADGYSTSTSLWRGRATPFGFGTQLGSLSSGQFAILVALGLAKSR